MNTVSFKEAPKHILIRIENDLDNLFVLKYKHSLIDLIDNKRKEIVIFDLAKTTFIDSSGIGLLIYAYKVVKDYNGKFAICGVNNNIKKTIAISGLANSINVYEEIYENIKDCVVNQI